MIDALYIDQKKIRFPSGIAQFGNTVAVAKAAGVSETIAGSRFHRLELEAHVGAEFGYCLTIEYLNEMMTGVWLVVGNSPEWLILYSQSNVFMAQ